MKSTTHLHKEIHQAYTIHKTLVSSRAKRKKRKFLDPVSPGLYQVKKIFNEKGAKKNRPDLNAFQMNSLFPQSFHNMYLYKKKKAL